MNESVCVFLRPCGFVPSLAPSPPPNTDVSAGSKPGLLKRQLDLGAHLPVQLRYSLDWQSGQERTCSVEMRKQTGPIQLNNNKAKHLHTHLHTHTSTPTSTPTPTHTDSHTHRLTRKQG